MHFVAESNFPPDRQFPKIIRKFDKKVKTVISQNLLKNSFFILLNFDPGPQTNEHDTNHVTSSFAN